MKHFKTIMIMLSALVLPVVVAGNAGAATMSVQHEITVTATVLPARTIIVDERGSIVEVVSNTELDVMPQVYLDSVAAGNERQLSADVYRQYREYVPPGTGQAGVLYERDVLAVIGVRDAGQSAVSSAVVNTLISRL